jgi:hypothetical protein
VAYLLLVAAQAAGLLLIPFSSLGVWPQLLALGVYAWQTGFEPIGIIPLAVLVGIGIVVELIRLAIGARGIPTATRRRLGISGLAGGTVGAVAGVWMPLVGSMFGALIGSAAASLIGTLTLRSELDPRSRNAASALAMALTTATGVAIATFSLLVILQ